MGKIPGPRIWSVVRAKDLSKLYWCNLNQFVFDLVNKSQSLYRDLYFRGLMDYSRLGQMRKELTPAKIRQVLPFWLGLFVKLLPFCA